MLKKLVSKYEFSSTCFVDVFRENDSKQSDEFGAPCKFMLKLGRF